MQARNFGGTFDQLFLWNFFMQFSQKMPLYFFYTMVQKKVKNDEKLKSRGVLPFKSLRLRSLYNTTLAKKIETGTQAKHRRMHAW